VGVALDGQGAAGCPQRHHQFEVLGGLGAVEGGLQLVDLGHLDAFRRNGRGVGPSDPTAAGAAGKVLAIFFAAVSAYR
jgi:hypothetical protein